MANKPHPIPKKPLIRHFKKKLQYGQKDYVSIIFWGDVHVGSPHCWEEKAKEMLDYCLANDCYLWIMGDLLEVGLRDSVGDSIYTQTLSPESQMDRVLAWLRPLAQARRIIGMHEGNHEQRISQRVDFDITKLMRRDLCVGLEPHWKPKYFGYSAFTTIQVGSMYYQFYTTHGSSGSRFPHTKLKAIMDIHNFVDVDVVAMGHVHDLQTSSRVEVGINFSGTQIEEKEKFVLLTGSYLNWDDSYGQIKNMAPAIKGSPELMLWPLERRIEVKLHKFLN